MSATLTLDKHELLWLAEGAMGKSHLRWDIYPMFINTIYPQLNDDERLPRWIRLWADTYKPTERYSYPEFKGNYRPILRKQKENK